MATVDRRQDGQLRFINTTYPSPTIRNVDMWANAPLLEYAMDPSIAHRYFNHFHTYAAADWTVTEQGAAGTEAIGDELGGVLVLTSDALDDDSVEMQHVGEAWLLTPGNPLWAEFKVKVAKAVQSDFWLGFNATDTTLIDGSQDGLWFQKDDGDQNVDYHSDKDNNDSTGDTGFDVTAATYACYGLYFDGVATVQWWINNEIRASYSGANLNDDEEMRLSFGYQNGEAGATTMSIDYIDALQVL